MTNDNKCRCGYVQTDGTTHPCHGMMYTCRKPAKQRFQVKGPAYLAGVQMKFSATDTWSCDDCWDNFLAKVAEVVSKGPLGPNGPSN